jgi:phosphatidylethanolamine-binding protein (PEBP) family uncharacterized protein
MNQYRNGCPAMEKYKMNRLLSIWILLFAYQASVLDAHPGHQHDPNLRVWKDADGIFEIEASFMLLRDSTVQLCKHDGSVISLPLSKLSSSDQAWIQDRVNGIRRINTTPFSGSPEEVNPNLIGPLVAILAMLGLAAIGRIFRNKPVAIGSIAALFTLFSLTAIATAIDHPKIPTIQNQFEAFKKQVQLRFDSDYFYLESNGMPDHRMMVGITAWQQQVPLPQDYKGKNAWRIPLNPRMAANPVSAKEQLFRGAIAIAVNGVPIFNPIKNDGKTDTLIAGELDEFGGHCGRGDDYHYHIGPVHLQQMVGAGNPIGYALDGYPLYGYTDSNGKVPTDLDEFNGRMEADGYRYYSTKKYPYINGGMRGVVTVKDDQIDPQPRAYSPRPALTPLRGAKITGFERDDAKKSVTVKYEQNGKVGSVKYIGSAANYQFEFKSPSGTVTTETYRIQEDGKRPPQKKGDPKKDGQPKKGDRPPPKKDNEPQSAELAPMPKTQGKFILSSPAFEHKGKMPAEFTGDGAGISPPLKWTGAPEGTKLYAFQLWHKPRADSEEVKSYWVVTNIPASVTSLEKNSKGVGLVGLNDKKRAGYDPMNSKGPGEKLYHITMYALSKEPKFASEKFTREELLKAIKDITLAETTLSYTYERKK